MRTPALFSKIQTSFVAQEKARKTIASIATKALQDSKRAIFAIHRDDLELAKKTLSEVHEAFSACEKYTKLASDLPDEGVLRAAREEYTEAVLFLAYVQNEPFRVLDRFAKEPSIYLAALSDATGEMVRYATRKATDGEVAEIDRAFETVEMIILYLLELDLTGYLRTKFDQAKKNLRALEQMRYDWKLRRT